MYFNRAKRQRNYLVKWGKGTIYRLLTSSPLWNFFEVLYLKLSQDSFKYPPRHVRNIVGGPSIREYAVVGYEFTIYLKLLCDLKPNHRILEIGCGCGRIAQHLTDFITKGSYEGLDVNKGLIEYAKREITPRHLNFKFHHIDVYSGTYNVSGRIRPSEFVFPYGDSQFDIAFLASVFTHMTPPGLKNYISEISRVLKPNGIVMSTFHLVKNLSMLGSNYDIMPAGIDSEHYRVVNPNEPEKNVAYIEDYVLSLFKNAGFEIICPPYYGKWSNANNYLSWQDILLLRKVALNY